MIAGNLYRLLARKLPRYEHATPDRLWRHFLDSTGTLHITDDALTLELRVRTYHPVLIDAGLADQTTPSPDARHGWLPAYENLVGATATATH